MAQKKRIHAVDYKMSLSLRTFSHENWKCPPVRFSGFDGFLMASLSAEGWLSLAQMITTRTVLEGEKETKENFDGSKPVLEKVFPVYAVGFSKPNQKLVDSVTNSGGKPGDPIWDAIREEAKYEEDKEPILSSFLYASILSHHCLEQSLAFVLANRLQDPTLLATQLLDIFFDVIMHDRVIQRCIRLDIQACKDRDPSCLSYCSALLCLKGYHSLQAHRVAHALWNQGRKVLASALQSRISEVFGVDIHPAAKIGEGILMDHATGVVIGETAVVENRVSLMQGVTLGGTGKETGNRHPKVGEGVLIGAGATILGNIKIGEGAMIAAGSLVLEDVLPHSMVEGIPAKVIGNVDEQDPSLTMKHDATKHFFEKVADICSESRSSEMPGRPDTGGSTSEFAEAELSILTEHYLL